METIVTIVFVLLSFGLPYIISEGSWRQGVMSLLMMTLVFLVCWVVKSIVLGLI